MNLPDLTSRPLTCLITAGELDQNNFAIRKQELVSHARCCAEAGVSMIQIREKALPANMCAELTRNVLNAVRPHGTLCFVNERFDIAMACSADGVHLTSGSIPLDLVREVVPHSFGIGVSTHTTDEVTLARTNGADFAIFGPVFETPSKSAEIGWKGIAGLEEACAAANGMPVLGIGGMDRANLKEVIGAGASGIAGIRLFSELETVELLVKQLNENG